MAKRRGYLFGLNYANDSTAKLNGCINDVKNMAAYLQDVAGIPCETFTDDVNQPETSASGMLNRLYKIAKQSYSDNLDLVWIHYSGHGSYVTDSSGDEKDGRDEALVPSDFRTAGLISDDSINSLFSSFNPKTRVICVFDCCHSGTIGDVLYSWEGPKKVVVENILCQASGRVITLSGCLDTQLSADAQNVFKDNEFAGAMTSCLLMALNENKSGTWANVFTLVKATRDKLKKRGFQQVPKLCSTHNLAKDMVLIPV